MLSEVLLAYVENATPSDFGLEYSRDVWASYLAKELGAPKPLPERTVQLEVAGPPPAPGFPPTVQLYPVRMAQQVFEDPLDKTSPRYLTTLLDDELDHSLPEWDLARVVWDSFTSPAGLLP